MGQPIRRHANQFAPTVLHLVVGAVGTVRWRLAREAFDYARRAVGANLFAICRAPAVNRAHAVCQVQRGHRFQGRFAPHRGLALLVRSYRVCAALANFWREARRLSF